MRAWLDRLKGRRLLGAAAIALTAVVAACGESSSSSSTPSGGGTCSAGNAAVNLGGTPTVMLQATDNLTFTPQTASASVGQIVHWTNGGSVGHTITFDSGNASCLTDPSFNGGSTWDVKFSAAGTYAYHCTIHPQMTGTLTVQ
ncbi:MAG: plastocyanin/azurin family copper-binding protein [Candidatus Dormibacteria bacterium]